MVRGRGSLGPSHHHQGSNNNCLTARSTGCGGGEEPTSLPKLPLPPPPPPFPLFLLRLVWSKHLSALALSPAEKRLQRAPYIFQRIRTHQRPSGHHSSSFHMWKRLFSMQFAAALKHEERERERAEISAPRHRKYHSFRARVSSSCSSWVSAAALPASQRRLNRKKDCFRTKEEKKREERKEERKRFAKLFFFFLSPTVDSLEAYFFFLGGKRGVYLKALSSQFQTLLSFSSFFCPKITTVC